MNINIRKYQDGDEIEIAKVIAITLREVNIKDESSEEIEELILELNEEKILNRSKWTHMYVIVDDNNVIGVGAIGPYWNSLTESSFFNIFILPEYQGYGLGRKLIETLENDEYFKRADRIEIPASITGLEFYRHMGYGFKKNGNILDKDKCYRLEKYPKINNNNNDINQYNMRPFIDNKYHNYYEFIYQCKKEAYQKHVETYWSKWDENKQREYFKQFIKDNHNNLYIIGLNGKDIGFYQGYLVDENTYEVGNICIRKEYQGRGIGTQILEDILEKYLDKDIKLQYFKGNKVGNLYERLGFILVDETEYHYQMVKPKRNVKTK